jgi:hypothetical protein
MLQVKHPSYRQRPGGSAGRPQQYGIGVVVAVVGDDLVGIPSLRPFSWRMKEEQSCCMIHVYPGKFAIFMDISRTYFVEQFASQSSSRVAAFWHPQNSFIFQIGYLKIKACSPVLLHTFVCV